MLRHHDVAQNELGAHRAMVAEAQKTLKDALYTADVVSKDQDKKIKEHERTIENMQKSMDELKKAIETEKKATEEERKATEKERKATEKEREKTDAQASVKKGWGIHAVHTIENTFMLGLSSLGSLHGRAEQSRLARRRKITLRHWNVSPINIIIETIIGILA